MKNGEASGVLAQNFRFGKTEMASNVANKAFTRFTGERSKTTLSAMQPREQADGPHPYASGN